MDQQPPIPAEDNIDRRDTCGRALPSQRFQDFLLENETFKRLHSLQVKHDVNDRRTNGCEDFCICFHREAAEGLRSMFPVGLADSITLPGQEGGHRVLPPLDNQDPLIKVAFADVTMYAAELGVQSVPKDHPEAQKLLAHWPHSKQIYDLVICDGQALRTQNVPQYRRLCEQSHIQVFKPKKFHAEKSSFYLIAKNVRSQSQEARDAAEIFRRSWMRSSFPDSSEPPGGKDKAGDVSEDEAGDDDVRRMLQDFGDKFVRLMRSVWMAQATALSNASWMDERSDSPS
ncbi:hypothetical protein K469DRAFT_692356 [Zopfia rhizophila CBS 207.26]|uniref:Uncharacterized protein n=1 Tax=Zopfia rhizophila CBS 207.26 TaxID=1314779 RepID=A0A6A6DNQ5_9PEZI|nr:hypothetical protein K469DRAFT_692356 [Zopfia rhizophila CBS 207.26]